MPERPAPPASPQATADTDTMPTVEALIWADEAERERARRYHRLRRRLGVALAVGDVTRRAAFLGLGGASALESALRSRLPHPALVAPAYALTLSGMNFVLDLPTGYLAGYRVEREFGLTKQPAGDWLRQRLLGFAIGTSLQVAILSGLHVLVRRRPDDWWLVVSASVVPATVAISTLFPTVIMPRFNRFTPLADQELVARLRALGERAGVTVADVYEMDMSRQTERANAMFTGLGGTRRIVLGDTLTRSFAPAETEGVIAHELGHQVNGDIWRLAATGAASVTAIAAATQRLSRPVLAATAPATGIRSTDQVAALSVLGAIAGAAGTLLSPLPALLSRRIERRTDRFAIDLTGDPLTYARALARLGRGNMVDPDPPRWRERLLSSHPALVDRIGAALAAAKGPR